MADLAQQQLGNERWSNLDFMSRDGVVKLRFHAYQCKINENVRNHYYYRSVTVTDLSQHLKSMSTQIYSEPCNPMNMKGQDLVSWYTTKLGPGLSLFWNLRLGSRPVSPASRLGNWSFVDLVWAGLELLGRKSVTVLVQQDSLHFDKLPDGSIKI
jgi:hypothetical protein